MVHIDRSARSSFEALPPGPYLVEIRAAEIKRSKKDGTPYFNVRLEPVEAPGKVLCWDIWMLDGKGLGMTNARLDVLGFDSAEANIDPADLIGRRAWVATKLEDWQGEDRLRVDVRARGFKCGYRSEADPPPASDGADAEHSPIADFTGSSTAKAIPDEDVPF